MECFSSIPLKNKKVLVMISGGMDSVALLHSLNQYQSQVSFHIEAIHFNYHLRGQESDDDAQFVKEFCDQLNIKCFFIDSPILEKTQIQNRAREIRYQKIIDLQFENNWDYIFSAHHLHDQIETILMRMDRGAGVRGLRGIEKERILVENCILYRPFLDFSKFEIKKYIEDHQLTYREDSSNQSLKYFRNQIRENYKEFLSNIKTSKDNPFQEMLESLNQSYEEISNQIDKIYFSPNFLRMTKEDYLDLKDEVRFYLLECVFKNLNYDQQFSGKNFLFCEKLIRQKDPKIHYFGNIQFFSGYDWIYIRPKYEFNLKDWSCEIRVHDGEYYLEPINKKLILKKVDLSRVEIKKKRQQPILDFNDLDQSLFLSLEDGQSIKIRFFQNGDGFIPFGRSKPIKLKDFFINKRVSKLIRPYLPLIEKDQEVISVVGIEISERMKLKNQGFSIKLEDI